MKKKKILCAEMGNQCETRGPESYYKSYRNEKPKVTDANQKSKGYVDINAISGEANEDTYEEGLKI